MTIDSKCQSNAISQDFVRDTWTSRLILHNDDIILDKHCPRLHAYWSISIGLLNSTKHFRLLLDLPRFVVLLQLQNRKKSGEQKRMFTGSKNLHILGKICPSTKKILIFPYDDISPLKFWRKDQKKDSEVAHFLMSSSMVFSCSDGLKEAIARGPSFCHMFRRNFTLFWEILAKTVAPDIFPTLPENFKFFTTSPVPVRMSSQAFMVLWRTSADVKFY